MCHKCRENILPPKVSCLFCGREPIMDKKIWHYRSATCGKCRESKALHGIISAGGYNNLALRRAIHWLKFKQITSLADVLGELVIGGLIAIAPLLRLREEGLLVPVPLHWRRERQRSFNQSKLLAERISNLTGVATADFLERPRQTYTQSKLPREFRDRNLAQAFKLEEGLPKKNWFLIVDDVTTSGSTLESAAQVLRQNGASEVWGVTIARG